MVDEAVSTSKPTTGVDDCGMVVELMSLLRGRKLLLGYLTVRPGLSEIDHVCRDNRRPLTCEQSNQVESRGVQSTMVRTRSRLFSEGR